MNKKQIRLLTQIPLIGALYVVLTLINPISYGMFQFRLSTLLMGVPFYKPQLSLGILIGVMISNIPSPLGPIDILSGFLIQSVSLYVFNRIFQKFLCEECCIWNLVWFCSSCSIVLLFTSTILA